MGTGTVLLFNKGHPKDTGQQGVHTQKDEIRPFPGNPLNNEFKTGLRLRHKS